MATIQPGIPPPDGSRVSQLRAVYEQMGAKPGEQVRLMKGQTSASGPREAAKLNPTQNPPPANSLKSAECLKTAENVHNNATIPFVASHSGPYTEEKAVITQHIKLSTPLEVKQEKVLVEEKIDALVQWKFSPTEHEHVHIHEIAPEMTLQFVQKAPEQKVAENADKAEAAKADVQFEAVGSSDEAPESSGGIESFQPATEQAGGLEQEVTAFLEQADSMSANPEAITSEHTGAALEFINKIKSDTQQYGQLDQKLVAKFEKMEQMIQGLHTDLTGASQETKEPEEHWMQTLSHDDLKADLDQAGITKKENALRTMLADIAEESSKTGGTVTLDQLPKAKELLNLMTPLRTAKWASKIDQDLRNELFSKVTSLGSEVKNAEATQRREQVKESLQKPDATVEERKQAVQQLMNQIQSIHTAQKTYIPETQVNASRELLALAEGIKNTSWYGEIPVAQRDYLDGLARSLGDKINAGEAARFVSPLQTALKNPEATVAEKEAIIESMLSDIQTMAAKNEGKIPPAEIQKARHLYFLLKVTIEAKGEYEWANELSTATKETLTYVKETIDTAIKESLRESFISDVKNGIIEKGRYAGIPKRYEVLRSNLFKWAEYSSALADHEKALLKESAEPDEKTRNTLVERRKTMIEQGKKNVHASFEPFEEYYNTLTQDIQKFQELGLDKTHPKEFKVLTNLRKEVSQLIENPETGELRPPSKEAVKAWNDVHYDSSPGVDGLAKDLVSFMNNCFGDSMLIRQSDIDIGTLIQVTSGLLTLVPEKREQILKFQEFCKEFKLIIEEASKSLKSMTKREGGADPFYIKGKVLSPEQQVALEKARTAAETLRNKAQELAVGLPGDSELQKKILEGHVDINYEVAQKNTLGGLPNLIQAFVKQLSALETHSNAQRL